MSEPTTVAAPGSLGLELGFASSAATGDALFDLGNGFSPNFSRNTAARGAAIEPAAIGGADGGNTVISGLVRELAMGVAVALAARFLWQQMS